MSFDAWNRGRGDRQLRVVQPDGFEQTQTAAFVLGSDEPGYIEQLAKGDLSQVQRLVNTDGINFIRARFRLRGPETAPPDPLFWECSILVDDVKEATAVVPVGRTRDVQDLAVHVSKLTGDHTVAFRLQLTE